MSEVISAKKAWVEINNIPTEVYNEYALKQAYLQDVKNLLPTELKGISSYVNAGFFTTFSSAMDSIEFFYEWISSWAWFGRVPTVSTPAYSSAFMDKVQTADNNMKVFLQENVNVSSVDVKRISTMLAKLKKVQADCAWIQCKRSGLQKP